MCGKVPSPIALHNDTAKKCGFYGDWSSPVKRFSSAVECGQIVSTFYVAQQLDAIATLANASAAAHPERTGDARKYAARAAQTRKQFDAAYCASHCQLMCRRCF